MSIALQQLDLGLEALGSLEKQPTWSARVAAGEAREGTVRCVKLKFIRESVVWGMIRWLSKKGGDGYPVVHTADDTMMARREKSIRRQEKRCCGSERDSA